MWGCMAIPRALQQATDSKFELIVWCKSQHPHTQVKRHSTQAQLRPDHLALQASYRLKIWVHNLMQDRAFSDLRKKQSTQAQHRPDPVALQASFRFKVQTNHSPQGGGVCWYATGVKNASKIKRATVGPYRPLEGSRCRDPPSSVPIWCKNHNHKLSTQKISTQTLLRPDHLALQGSLRLKIWAHNLM
jgi:hypothetical protein